MHPNHDSFSISPQPSAAAQVFGITELLENILLHLGELDQSSWTRLFPVQRVNRRFQSVIQDSPSLKQAMYLEPAKRAITRPDFPAVLASYRTFFSAVQAVLDPFWCHLRPSTVPGELILALNVTLFWTEESPGVMVGRAPLTFDGSNVVKQEKSWRRLRIPYHTGQHMELHCCGYPVADTRMEGITLGELADKVISAGDGHLGGLQPVIYYS